MKPSNEELLLSKNSAKTLLVRNAVDAATLVRETRQLQKERTSEERLLLKKREHMLQRQSSLVGELTPKLRRKDINGRQRILSASTFPLTDQHIPPLYHRYKSKTASGLVRSNSVTGSLPDIYATAQGKTGLGKLKDDTKRRWKGCNRKNGGECEETCSTDDWKELENCRYLRTSSVAEREYELK